MELPTRLLEPDAHAEFLAMQNYYNLDADTPLQRYEYASTQLTKFRQTLDVMDDDQLLDIADTAGNMLLADDTPRNAIEVDPDMLEEVFDGLIVAHIAQNNESLESIKLKLGLDDEDWTQLRQNIDTLVIPDLTGEETDLESGIRALYITIFGTDEDYFNPHQLNFDDRSRTLGMLISKPRSDEEEAAIERLNDSADIVNEAIFVLPYIDEKRALALYQKGLETSPAVATTIAIGLMHLTKCVGESALPLWRKALEDEDYSVRSEALESLQNVLESDSASTNEEFARRLRILYNAHKSDLPPRYR